MNEILSCLIAKIRLFPQFFNVDNFFQPSCSSNCSATDCLVRYDFWYNIQLLALNTLVAFIALLH